MLLVVFQAHPALFRTGWFVESLLTELLIALIVRTRRPFFRSRPGTVLLWSSLVLIGLTFAIPYLPFPPVLGVRVASGNAGRHDRRNHRDIRRGGGADETLVLPHGVG